MRRYRSLRLGWLNAARLLAAGQQLEVDEVLQRGLAAADAAQDSGMVALQQPLRGGRSRGRLVSRQAGQASPITPSRRPPAPRSTSEQAAWSFFAGVELRRDNRRAETRQLARGVVIGNEEPVRTGEEAHLREELKEVDAQVDEPIADNPKGTREQRRRSKYTDLHGDEDLDPNTSEANNR